MNRRDFQCITISPGDLSSPSIAIATSRAGGIGLLDLEFSYDTAAIEKNLSYLMTATDALLGLRLNVNQIETSQSLLTQLSSRTHWVLLSGANPNNYSNTIATLLDCDQRKIIVELSSAEHASELRHYPIYGVTANGHECGGWIGEDAAFILTQKLIDLYPGPVYVRGSIGLYSATGCRAAGASGVILSEELLMMPESPLEREWQSYLKNLSGQETIIIEGESNSSCRVLSLPGFSAAKELQKKVKQTENEVNEDGSTAFQIGWGDPHHFAWPVGQGVGLAASLQQRYKTTGRLVQAIIDHSAEYIAMANSQHPLAPNTPLAQCHGTRYPIVQGPMTRVSDTSEFADAVSKGGALPMLALALMNSQQVSQLLKQTSERLGKRSWGVGLLGFIPESLWEQQLHALRETKPTFALIAGGRPDQAAIFEAQGIPTYIHVPSPKLLPLFIEQGARRFVFEGRECGGHVGPLSSFTLWNSVIDYLHHDVPKKTAAQIQVLFAGGIHDACSAAMISAMAAPLANRNICVGVLMGTAYLFTDEIVTTGAITKPFQEQALACTNTATLETGPGHASRCALSPFVNEFRNQRQHLLRGVLSDKEITQQLDELTLGRLRIASKGLIRDNKGQLCSIDINEQQRKGMYMIGQVGTMHDKTTRIEALHHAICTESAALLSLQEPNYQQKSNQKTATPSDIAIIGIGTLLPGANNTACYWDNILNKVNVLTEIPAHRWDWRLYYDSNPSARDKIMSKWGGFLEDVPFDPLRYGIPPNSLKSIEPMQLLTLEVVRQALTDAGLEDGRYDRDNTSVILGAGGGVGDLGQHYGFRSEIPRFIDSISDDVWDRLPEWTEESFPGLLLNVLAGRVSSRFDLGGLNFTVDAACASSLAAINIAVNELESGRSNMVIAGGVDAVQSPFAYMCFSKTQALSPTGKVKTFDKNSDGIVISEGLAVVVLKRLADAKRDGDRIYAVIKAVAGSSDGKGRGLTAPLPAGQMRALSRAYEKAGFYPNTLGLMEAHGTGTSVGDQTEVDTISTSLKAHHAEPKTCAIGSVKTLIGHTKASAGVAGMIKAALALHHKVIPPHAGVTQPLDSIAEPDSPVYIPKQAMPWLAPPTHPRRAGVSAFGFGGTNFHAVLEEYTENYLSTSAPLGTSAWPHELLSFRAQTIGDLRHRMTALRNALNQGANPKIRDLAYTLAINTEAQMQHSVSLSIVTSSLEELKKDLNSALAHIEHPSKHPLPHHILLQRNSTDTKEKIAFLFPGQGAQYLTMGRDAALYFIEMRHIIETATQQYKGCFPEILSRYIYPPAVYDIDEEKRQNKRLTDTHIAQSSLATIEIGYLNILKRLGVRPDMVAGHSFGEYAALFAADTISQGDFLTLAEVRGRISKSATQTTAKGCMAVVQTSIESLRKHFTSDENKVIANHNAPNQCVISGTVAAINSAINILQENGITTQLLPVDGAFHSHLMATAQAPLSKIIHDTVFNEATIPVYANATGQPYPREPKKIRAQLSTHLLSPVHFVDQINTMYQDGARLFVEIGPKNTLSTLTQHILGDRDCTILSIDGNGRNLRGILIALAALTVKNVITHPTALFAGREVNALDLAQLPSSSITPSQLSTTWLVNGGSTRRSHQPPGQTGTLPPLSSKTINSKSRNDISLSIPPPNDLTNTQRTFKESVVMHYPNNTIPIHDKTTAGSRKSSNHSNLIQAPAMHPHDALIAYQKTMQQFLTLQEQVMRYYFNGATHQDTSSPFNTDTEFYSPDLSSIKTLSTDTHSANANAAFNPEDIQKETKRPVTSVDTIQPYPDAHISTLSPSFLEQQDVGANCQQQDTSTSTTSMAEKPSGTPQNNAELLASIQKLVSERTGYPVDMLGVDQDMEADLGIDSIKRVEILGALQKILPEPSATRLKNNMDRFTRAKSLNDIVEELTNEKRVNPALANENKIDSTIFVSESRVKNLKFDHDITSSTMPLSLPRYVITAKEEALATHNKPDLSGLIVITEDLQSVAPELASILRQHGATVEIIHRVTLISPNKLNDNLDLIRKQHGPIGGIIHIASLSNESIPSDMNSWQSLVQIHTKSIFQILRTCASDLQRPMPTLPWRVVSASQLGGSYGRHQSTSTLPLGGCATGLLKTISAEWPDVSTKTLDFDTTLTAHELASCIFKEFITPGSNYEIGYINTKRSVFQTVAAPFLNTSEKSLTPNASWVVLITGGARGITAEVALELAPFGVTLILTGRSALPSPENDETRGIHDTNTLRNYFIARTRSQGLLPSPALINTQINDLLKNREIRNNIDRLSAAGANVEYRSVNVRNESEFSNFLEDIYALFGRLDAVIHGAGIIKDKLIIDKSDDDFASVFGTKVDGGFLLSQHLKPHSLKLLVFFASVAGRYGNRGQIDYAAANEVINRLAWQLNFQWPHTRVISINWGPWDTTGMASEEVKRQFRERGVIPIAPDKAQHYFMSEIHYGQKDDVEIIVGEGPWAHSDADRITNNDIAPAATPYALFSSPLHTEENGIIFLNHTFTLSENPYLKEHSLDGQLVMPATGAAEWMGQFVQRIRPGWHVVEIRDLRVLSGLILSDEGRKQVSFRCSFIDHSYTNQLNMVVEISDLTTHRPLYRATLGLRQQPLESPSLSVSPLNTSASLEVINAYEDYLFHGPCFHLLQSIERINENGVDANVTSSQIQDWVKSTALDEVNDGANLTWIFDPGLLDTAPQLAIVWSRNQRNVTALPTRFGLVNRYGNGPLPKTLKLLFRVTQVDEQVLIYDATFLGEDGTVHLMLKDIESTCSAALNRLAEKRITQYLH